MEKQKKGLAIAALVFASAAVYGSVTKRSIKGWGGWLMMGLMALIAVSLINLFLGSSMLEMLISGVGVVDEGLDLVAEQSLLQSLNLLGVLVAFLHHQNVGVSLGRDRSGILSSDGIGTGIQTSHAAHRLHP